MSSVSAGSVFVENCTLRFLVVEDVMEFMP